MFKFLAKKDGGAAQAPPAGTVQAPAAKLTTDHRVFARGVDCNGMGLLPCLTVLRLMPIKRSENRGQGRAQCGQVLLAEAPAGAAIH